MLRYCEKLRGLGCFTCSKAKSQRLSRLNPCYLSRIKPFQKYWIFKPLGRLYVDVLKKHHFDFAHEDIFIPEALVVLSCVQSANVSLVIIRARHDAAAKLKESYVKIKDHVGF